MSRLGRRLRRLMLGRLVATMVGSSVVVAGGALLAGVHLQVPTPSEAPTRAGVLGLIVAAGHGWSSAGLDGPVPAPGACHYRRSLNREPLPDPRCTPGAIDPQVTQGNLRSTVCRPGGYTASVRPPLAVTEPVKRRLMAAYGIPWSQARHYQLDHLVEENIGGASDVRNLWPEPNIFLTGTASASAFIQNDKDQLASYTFHALCAGRVRLTVLQRAVATDWSTTVHVLGLRPIPNGYTG